MYLGHSTNNCNINKNVINGTYIFQSKVDSSFFI